MSLTVHCHCNFLLQFIRHHFIYLNSDDIDYIYGYIFWMIIITINFICIVIWIVIKSEPLRNKLLDSYTINTKRKMEYIGLLFFIISNLYGINPNSHQKKICFFDQFLLGNNILINLAQRSICTLSIGYITSLNIASACSQYRKQLIGPRKLNKLCSKYFTLYTIFLLIIAEIGFWIYLATNIYAYFVINTVAMAMVYITVAGMFVQFLKYSIRKFSKRTCWYLGFILIQICYYLKCLYMNLYTSSYSNTNNHTLHTNLSVKKTYTTNSLTFGLFGEELLSKHNQCDLVTARWSDWNIFLAIQIELGLVLSILVLSQIWKPVIFMLDLDQIKLKYRQNVKINCSCSSTLNSNQMSGNYFKVI